MQFTVYFEIFGKKMKTTIEADSHFAARAKVKDKIIFHKVEEKKERTEEDIFNDLKNIFNI